MDILEIGSDYTLTASGSLSTIYADDTTETAVKGPGGATKYQTDVFDIDTTVRVTVLSDTNLNMQRTAVCCYSSGTVGYYGKTFDHRFQKNMPYSFEYMVHAGYRLATCIPPQCIFIENVGEV